MNQHKRFTFVMLLLLTVTVNAQLGIGTETPEASALLDITSSSKGFLPPRMTTAQRDAIANAATGLVIFNNTTNSLQVKSSSGWVTLIAESVFMPSVVIGKQQWMAKNLEVAFYRNGDEIPQVTNPAAFAALTTGAWCYMNNSPTDGNTYGKLYNWYAVNDARGLAPVGWHIPDEADWTLLETNLGGVSVAGGKIKEAGNSHWTTPNTGANNNSSFLGLPGGFRGDDGSFVYLREVGLWWSATQKNASSGFCHYVTYVSGSLSPDYYLKKAGLSVRCIRD